MNRDIKALCAAIDAGDDESLPILADALEDAGFDPAIVHSDLSVNYFGWVSDGGRPDAARRSHATAGYFDGIGEPDHPATISCQIWRKICLVKLEQIGTSSSYKSKWAWGCSNRRGAYLALAKALSE